MSDEPSFRLYSVKLIIYLNFLRLFGFEFFTCQGDTNNGYLPPGEASALSTVADQFKSKVINLPSSRSYCQHASSNYGYDITCDDCKGGDGTVCHIIEIKLSDLGLTGTIDEAVGDLPYLEKLVLSNNELQGEIPTSLGNLIFLDTLDLSNNQLTGTIPSSLGALVKLRWLYLQNNFLEGSIPSALGGLSFLNDLYLSFNKLSGSIPDELGSLRSLSRLLIAENNLSGRLPSTLGKLSNLVYFWVPSNYLIGELPDSYRSLHNLKTFCVAGNNISGRLPQYVNNWPQIQLLSFEGNSFEGKIPKEFFNLQTLEYLLVSDLKTTPFQLPSKAKVPNIYSLVLRNCSINGSIPKYISQASSLKYLDLSFNNLTGGIPESWKSNLIYMSFARNNLSGAIPIWLFQASQTRMDLSYNNFTEISAPVQTNLDLNLFACCCCQNSSTIRPHMLQPLQMMQVYFNGSKHKFHSLFINSGGEQTVNDGKHYEADNDTSRWHVSSVKNWAYSSSGDFLTAKVNSSDYTKRVPCKISNSEASIYEEARLSPVSLHYYALNLLHDKDKTYSVTLHFAEIVYSENADYNRLRKRIFDVYIQGENALKDFNIRDQAEGPDKAFNKTFQKIKVKNGLLDIHFYWTGKGSYDNAPAFNGPLISAISVTPDFELGGGLTPWQKALISIASILVSALLLLALAWGMGWLESKELQEEKNMGNNQKAKVRDIIKATKTFRQNKIGSGSLGTVYLVEVPKDHKVAVKKLSSNFQKRIHDLEAEILHMTTLKHDNLLNVLDVHIGERYQFLIYEYVQNKSLEDIFFGFSTFPKWELDWPTRYNICLGVANGLKKLHEDKRSIIHGNIKMTNILLDARKEAKLSDYGLARVYTDENRILQIKEEAPKGFHPLEYFQGLASDKSDVFSFGMVVLVIISGTKSEVDKATKGTEYLHDRAHYLHGRDKLIELVDGSLTDCDERQALILLNIAVRCTSSAPSSRPTISNVYKEIVDSKTLMITDTIVQPPTFTSKDGDKAIV